jgi:alpha-N-arabinofuranosidase
MNRINIDLERIVSDIDRNIFGGSMPIGSSEGPDKYLFSKDTTCTDKSGLRNDIRAVLERLNLPNIRFAGGDFISGYRWMDGVGPLEKRPGVHELAWGSVTFNRFGTNEFMQFCRKMNIQPYLTVNCGDGNMREAADFVEYCNGTGDTALVKLRTQHGFPDPHRVKYWGIGNEVDSLSEIGYKTPEEYARAITEFSKVMKRVDPEIKLIASAVCRWQDFPQTRSYPEPKTEWVERAQLMLEQAGDRIDYMAFHRLAHPSADEPFENYMAFSENYNEHLSAYEGIIRAVSLERGIKHAIGITVDEWVAGRRQANPKRDVPINVNLDEWGVRRLPDPVRREARRRDNRRVITLEDALVTALHLNAFIRHAYSVRMANSCVPMPQGIGFDSAHPDMPLLLPSIFYPIELYSRTCGQLALDVFWSSDTFTGTFRGRTYSGIRTLDVTATLDKTRNQVVVYVVNQSKDKDMETIISLTSGEFAENVKVFVLNGPDIKAENTEDKPLNVNLKESVVKASGKSFVFTFERHSVTALVCPVKK